MRAYPPGMRRRNVAEVPALGVHDRYGNDGLKLR
jgi:hypothetical protein